MMSSKAITQGDHHITSGLDKLVSHASVIQTDMGLVNVPFLSLRHLLASLDGASKQLGRIRGCPDPALLIGPLEDCWRD